MDVVSGAMPLEKLRTLLALLLKKISTPSRLKKLGFGSRLIGNRGIKKISTPSRLKKLGFGSRLIGNRGIKKISTPSRLKKLGFGSRN